MTDPRISFNDGASYEQMMGIWSALAGEIFLDWLALPPKLSWLDVGCGNGAFTEQIIRRAAPSAVAGIDPSEGQIDYAQKREAAKLATFRTGDAMALPFPDATFDTAVMALVIFFVPDPAKSIAEMTRVVRRGGCVATYAWDMEGGGFPLQILLDELRAMGFSPAQPPHNEASRRDVLEKLWIDAGLESVETCRIDVTRIYADFEDFWSAATASASMRPTLAAMSPDRLNDLKARVRAHLTEEADGRIVKAAWANAVKGRIPR